MAGERKEGQYGEIFGAVGFCRGVSGTTRGIAGESRKESGGDLFEIEPVASFLESYDFSGRTIIPFCSHGGGRLGQSVTAIGKLAPNAVIGTPLSVHYGGGSSMPADVAAWLAKNELNEEAGGKKR